MGPERTVCDDFKPKLAGAGSAHVLGLAVVRIDLTIRVPT